MKLLKCHIENFGKLSDYDYEFEDGLNTINEENGFGKTTFASFIKAMFYGLDFKRNSKLLYDRKKYEPWQGGAFGGSIEFETKGKKYKIERFFGKKETDDTFKLYDLSTNLECNDYTKNIGEEIFKINKEAYDRSTFISGQNMETSMNDSINAKLGNILESENDVNTSDKALKVLEDAIKNYKKTGGRGEINEKISEKTILEKKLEQSKIDEKNLQDRIEQKEKINEKIKQKEQEQENLKQMLTMKLEGEADKVKQENYRTLKESEEQSRLQLEEYKKFFGDEIPEDNEIDTLIEKCLLIEKYRIEINNYEISAEESKEIEDLKELFEDSDITEEKINKKFSEYNELNETRNKLQLNEEKVTNLNNEIEGLKKHKKSLSILNALICLISVGCISYGIVTFFNGSLPITMPLLIGGAALFVIFLIMYGFSKKREKKFVEDNKQLQNLNDTAQELQEEENHLQKLILDFVDQYTDNNLELDILLQLTEVKTRFNKYKEIKNNFDSVFEKQNEVLFKFNELEESVKNYLQKYFKTLDKGYPVCAQELKIKKNDYFRQKQDYDAKVKARQEYAKANGLEDLETSNVTINQDNKLENGQELNIIENQKTNIDLENITKEEIESKMSTLTEEINNLYDEKNYTKNQIEILESNLDTVFDIENELQELNQTIDEMNEDCKILEQTRNLLEVAKSQFSSHYLNRMQNGFLKKLEYINGSEMDINLDINLNVQINEQGANKEINYFSTGYKDLIYICMRLSLIDSLFEDEKPFIILDDPFVNLDKSKIKHAIDLLKNLSKDYQVIYFICHDCRECK